MTTAPSPSADALRDHMMAHEGAIPTSALGRLWRGGKSALGLASAMARSRRGDDFDAAAVASIVERLGTMKGIAMKAGQMLGYLDQAMPEPMRAMLSALQTASPATPLATVRAALVAALGARGELLAAGLEARPFAVASVGQVHRAHLPDGREVAVKVLHPGIEDAFRADFRAAGVGKMFAAMTGMSSVGPVIEEAKTAFLEECDFRLEAERQARFAALFADDPDLIVPEVLADWSGDGVLVTRWTPGRSLDAWLADAPTQAERDRVGAALFRFWMRTLYRDGLFHADPHPGNFAFANDGRIIVYDFGCVRAFEPRLREAFAALAAATRADDPAAMAAAITALGGRAPERGDDLRRLLRGFFGPLSTPGARRVAPDEGLGARDLMSDKRFVLRLGLPGRMLFLFRLRFGLYAVLARLGAEVDWAALESAWAMGREPAPPAAPAVHAA